MCISHALWTADDAFADDAFAFVDDVAALSNVRANWKFESLDFARRDPLPRRRKW